MDNNITIDNIIFKKIKNFDHYYINNAGDIFSTKINRLMKQQYDRDGYLNICLINKNNRKSFRVHRLVAQHFIKNDNKKPCVNHKNGIKDDNRVNNLEWCTNLENNNHAKSVLNIKRTGRPINSKDSYKRSNIGYLNRYRK